MTREEAIEVLEKMKYPQKVNRNGFIISNVNIENEALEMAIKALSQEPTEKPMIVDEMEREYEKSKALFHKIVECDDAISREDVLAEITRFSTEEGASVECQQLYCDVNNMPSVTHKSGKWIDKDLRKEEYVLTGKCSVCGQVRVIDKFCSHCGAKMESEDKG